jgi:hypothetical protein
MSMSALRGKADIPTMAQSDAFMSTRPSYRREDSAANALGIGQYLEHEFWSTERLHRPRQIPAPTRTTARVLQSNVGPNWTWLAQCPPAYPRVGLRLISSGKLSP